MGIRLIIEGNAVYEIDEDCLVCRREGAGPGQTVKSAEKPFPSGREKKAKRR